MMEKYCESCGRVFKDSDFKLCPYCGNQLSERVGRQPIPRKLRHQVFQRDNYGCRECGATNKQTRLHVDHIVPVAKGGTNDLNNLQTLYVQCQLVGLKENLSLLHHLQLLILVPKTFYML